MRMTITSFGLRASACGPSEGPACQPERRARLRQRLRRASVARGVGGSGDGKEAEGAAPAGAGGGGAGRAAGSAGLLQSRLSTDVWVRPGGGGTLVSRGRAARPGLRHLLLG